MKKTISIFFVSLLSIIALNKNCVLAQTINSNNIIANLNYNMLTNSSKSLNNINNNLIQSKSNDNSSYVFCYCAQQFNITQSDIDLMAKLVAGESIGEPYTGKVAVASVVLNRLTDPKFPNSIQDVIFQKNAFSCVHNNAIKSIPNEDCYRAVYDAINGTDPTNKALFFYNPDIATCNWMKKTAKVNELTIGHHTFFKVE